VVASFTAGGACKLEVPTNEEFAAKSSMDFDSYYLSPIALSVYSEVSKIALVRGLEGKVFSIHIKDWADDAQKNSSRTNLLSYNIRTITFLRHGRNGDIRYYTFVLSVGLKGSDHEEVERILSNDLFELGATPHLFYSGHHHGTFWGTVHLVAGVRDRPARGETFFVGIHSHSFGKRFRYAMYHDENTKIISCESCHARRVKNTRQQTLNLYSGINLPECDICADLDYSSKPTTQIDLAYLTGKSKAKDFAYPKMLVEGSPEPPPARLVGPNVKVLSPVKLDYAFLYAVCKCGFYNFHSRAHKLFMRRNKSEREKRALGPAVGWSGKELKSYLRTSSLNEAILKRTKSFSQKYIESPPSDVMDDFLSDVLPSAWTRSGYELSHQHDAVFHLAFHGILPDIWEMILKSVARFEIKRKWEEIVNISLSLLHGLQLDDLAVLPFGDKFSMAGWVGSNKMGFSWLLPYFVSHLERVLDLVKPNMGEDLKLEATALFLKIKRVVVSFQCVISRLLQRTLYPDLPMEVHHYVKILLCEVTNLQKTYIPESKRKEFAYLSTGNFLSMLNLEENLRMFGPIRNFWDAIDEKVVQRVKQAFSNVNMSSSRWVAAVLENITREQHLSMLWDRKLVGTKNRAFDSNLRITPEMEMRKTVLAGEPFTAIYDTGKFYIVFRMGGARSTIFCRLELIVFREAWMVDAQDFFQYCLSDEDPVEFNYSVLDDNQGSGLTGQSVLFIPYHRFPLIDDDEDEEEQYGNDELCSATIMELDLHRVFDGKDFIIPCIWGQHLDDRPTAVGVANIDPLLDNGEFI
jgi:hypothetical protein